MAKVPCKLDVFDFDAYERNPMEFYVVCTDIETGMPVYHKHTGRDETTALIGFVPLPPCRWFPTWS